MRSDIRYRLQFITNAPTEIRFFGRGKPLPYGHINFVICLCKPLFSEKEKAVIAFAVTALSFSLLLCVTPPLCYGYRQHLQRRNLPCLTDTRRFANCRLSTTFSKAELSAATRRRNLPCPRALSRCRLLRRRCLHTVSPSCRHRHSVLRYCPCIRQQGSFLPSYPRLYPPQLHNRSRYCRTVRQYTA